MDQQTYEKLLADLEEVDARDGLDINDLLFITDDLRKLLTWMVRRSRFDSYDLSSHTELDKSRIRELLAVLLRKGFIEITEAEEQVQYQTRVTGSFSRKYRVPSDVWKLLDDKKQGE